MFAVIVLGGIGLAALARGYAVALRKARIPGRGTPWHAGEFAPPSPQVDRLTTDEESEDSSEAPEVRGRMTGFDIEVPDGTNFFAVVETERDRDAVSSLYASAGWEVWANEAGDHHIENDWADLILERESKSSLLLHGPVAAVLVNADRLLDPLRRAAIGFRAEAYGSRNQLLQVWTSEGERAVEDLIQRLVSAAPALRSLLEDHLDENDELLPHVFFGDVTRFVVSGFADHPERRADAERILVLLEEAMGSPSEDVRNLVSVSFCENLLGDPPLEAIRAAMGPTLRAELATYEAR